MSSEYYRLKKHRKFKQFEQKLLSSSEDSDVEKNVFDHLDSPNYFPSDLPIEMNVTSNSPNHSQSVDTTSEHDNFDIDFEYSDRSPDVGLLDYKSPTPHKSPNSDVFNGHNTNFTVPSFREKLQCWAVKHRTNLTVATIDDLLSILQAENIPDLPKSACTLLQTKSNKNIKAMISSKNISGFYLYVGIEEGLKDIINHEFSESVIHLLFNIDGLPLFNGSNQQFWANLGLVLHNDYDSLPFIIALYSGDSKPKYVDDFLKDFVL